MNDKEASTAAMKRLMAITGRPEPLTTPGITRDEDDFMDPAEPAFSADELMAHTFPKPIITPEIEDSPIMEEIIDPVVMPAIAPVEAPFVPEPIAPAPVVKPAQKPKTPIKEQMVSSLQSQVEATTKRVVKEADPSFQEALDTKRTNTGSQIGSWQIVRDDSSGIALFSVNHADTGLCIARDMSLYEAAYGLAKSLYAGHGVNSHHVMTILRTESEYANALQDAIVFRQRRDASRQDEGRRAIFEDRYETAKSRALQSKAQIEILNKTIPNRKR